MVRGTDNTPGATGTILHQPLPTMKFLLIAATIKYWVAFYFLLPQIIFYDFIKI